MLNLATKHNDPNARLGWNERLGYGIGGCGWNMINAVLSTFMTVYFTNVALLDAAVISSILAVSKLFDGVSDLVVGGIVDRTRSKMGKARVWLLRMCVPFAMAVFLLFSIPSSFPTAAKYVYVFVMYNIVNTVCMTFMQVPFYSLISLMTKNSEERGMLGNVQQIFQTLGNVLINTYFVALLAHFSSSVETENTQAAYTGAMLVICAVMVILVLITVFFTKERVNESAKEAGAYKEDTNNEGEKVNPLVSVKALLTNKYWVIMFFAMLCIFFVIIFYSMGGVYYALYVLKDMDEFGWMANSINIAQFAIMFVTPIIMQKIDKRWIYAAGMALLAIGFGGFGLFGTSKTLMIFFNVLKGCGLGMAGGMAMGLVADAITYGTLKTGINAVGMGNAGTSAAQKLGLGMGTAVFGWVIAAAGFKGEYDIQGIPQPESVVTAIEFMYSWLPMIMCIVICVIMVVGFNLNRDLEKLRAEKGIEG